jgi:programmed cell death protein 5
MASDEELQRLREKRLMELQAQQSEEARAAKEEVETQKQVLLRKILTPEARQRLTNIKMVRPDFAEQLEIQLIQVAQSGRVKIPITDEALKKILEQLQAQQQQREIRIRRR